MYKNRIPDERLFQNHSREQLMQWCNGLQYFHYMRARGGHNCEGDSFCTYFKYEGRDDLVAKLSSIGVVVRQLEEGDIAFDPFESYSIDDLDKLKFTIPGLVNLIQPKHVEWLGYKLHIWVQATRFEISVSGTKADNTFKVSEEDFVVCQALESEFDKLGWNLALDDDIKEYAHCISRERYAELYS